MNEQNKEIYISILKCEEEINKINTITNPLGHLDDNIDKNLIKPKKNIEEKITNLKSAFNKVKEYQSQQFVDKVLSTCLIQCNIQDGRLSINEKTILKKIKKYLTELKDYINKFSTQGFFNEEDFKKLIQTHNIITNILETILSDEILSSDNECLFCSTINKQVLLSYKPILKQLNYYYSDFIDILSELGEKNLHDQVIKYVLNNTQLIHLVYTNNSHPLIKGQNSLKRLFLCQFHTELHPSMRVSINDNYYNCFGCGFIGNQIDYLIKKENITYNQAIYLLAEIYLIDIPNNPYKQQGIDLVDKYRKVLISEEYEQFILQSYRSVSEYNDENVSEIYIKILDTITRVKKEEYDPNFVFIQKDKKYEYKPELKLHKRFNGLWNNKKLFETSEEDEVAF